MGRSRHAARRAALLVVSAAALAACGSAVGGHGRPEAVSGPAAPGPTAPLATAATGTSGSWVVVPMGHLSQPLDTFWQLFYRATPRSGWTLRTPPGVADNGGLVAARSGSGIVVAFLPSQKLSFSPLALAAPGGAYQPGLVPAGLTRSPDALATSGRQGAALTGGAEAASLLTSPQGLTGWQRVTTVKALAATGATRTCGVSALTAVAVDDRAEAATVGASCTRPGVVGIIALSGGAHLAGPRLPQRYDSSAVDVLRLVADGHGLAALLRVHEGGSYSVIVAWDPSGDGRWLLSAPLSLRGPLLSTSVASGDRFAVLSGTAGHAMSAATAPDSTAWESLPHPPPGTATVAVQGAESEAFVVDQSTLRVFRLESGRWDLGQTIEVPIQYGSSS